MDEEELDQGIWCQRCGYLESEDDLEDNKCLGCGCPKNVHLKVKVVTVNGGVI
jgi:ribosomal protein L37E